MGAEGGIYIYRVDEIAKYPNGETFCDFVADARHYVHELEGIKYHTFYYGDNMCDYHPFVLDSYDYANAEKDGIGKKELDTFMCWLEYECPHTRWEVWT